MDGIERVRLGSLEPEKMDEDVIARLSKQSKLCPQFHLSLQSGSTTVLKRMNRHYTAEEYKKIVNDLRASFPNCSITTDIMTGFVGETKAEYIESMNFAKEIAFAKVHVFPYSRRKGTKADLMDNQIDESIKKIYNRLQREIFAESLVYKQCQLSLREKDSILRDHYYELICEIIQNENYDNIKILKSGHAIDIIGVNMGKQVFVESFCQIIGGDVLCIGDEGRIGQNDYDMLSENMALSVAGQNLLGYSGWNIAPMGVRNVKATEYYLNCIKAENGTFRFECT